MVQKGNFVISSVDEVTELATVKRLKLTFRALSLRSFDSL